MDDRCPSENTLLDVIVEQRVGEIARHLDVCDVCRELVAALAQPGERCVGRFEIVRVLGSGAMGIVYLARDPRLDREVALKVMHAHSPVRAVEEARAMAKLAHDNLVTIYEIEIVDDHVALAMEYQAGGSLREWLATRRTWREVVRVLRDVARGLAAIHDAGLVHRDLKPDNILFDATGRPRIADLGLATLHASVRAGTPAYMAPEQLDGGDASPRTDQWSFFVCMYEALAGKRPFAGTTQRSLRSAMSARACAITPGPRALHDLLVRGLATDPAARHPTMTSVVRALDALLARRKRRAIVIGAGAALVVPAAIAWAATARETAPCTGAGVAAAQAWNPARAARLATAYRDAAMAPTGAVVARGLDAYTQEWVAMHTESCEATHVRSEQSPALLDRRTQCLRERLAGVDAFVDALAKGDRATLARGGEAVLALPPIADCAPAQLVAQPRVLHPRGAAARIELARARALRPLGRAPDVIAIAEPLAALGTELDDRALVAEARLVVADALADDLQLARASTAFTAAELAGEAAADDDLRARALIAHASLSGALQQTPDDAAQLLARARAVMQRLGSRDALERRAVVAEAALAAARGDLASGERLLRGVVAKAPSTGPEAWQRIVALRDLANMIGEQGRPAEGVPFAREAVAVAETTLGPDHVQVSETLSVLALLLHFEGGDDEARALAARALAVKERARGAEHVSLSSTLMVQALIARDSKTATGHAEARRFTDRAIALRRKAYAADNPLLLALVSERGSLAVDAGEHAIARVHFAEAIPPLERAWGAASPAVVQARQSLATMSEREGDAKACAAYLAVAAAALASPVFEIDVHRAHCLLAAGAHREATELVTAIRRRELADAERASIDLVAARLARAVGQPGRAGAIADDVARRHPAPEPDLALDLALVWVELGEPARATALVDGALTGDDLAAVEHLLRAAEIALAAKQVPRATRFGERALVLARAAGAGPDTLARARCLAMGRAGTCQPHEN